MKKLLLTLILFLLPSSLFAGGMRIAVIDFQSKDMSAKDAAKISELIRNELIKTGRFTVIERAQMGKVLDEQGFQQTGCTDTSCAVKAGRMLSTRKILVGTLMKLGKNIIITGRVVDVESSVSEFSEKAIARSRNALPDTVSDFVLKLTVSIEEKAAKDEKEKIEQKRVGLTLLTEYNQIVAFGEFTDVAKIGMGGTLSFLYDFKNNFTAGLTTGYNYYPGADSSTDSFVVIPILLRAGYIINITRSLFIMPLIDAGVLYGRLSQDGETYSGTETLLRFGAGLGLNVGHRLFFQITPQCSTVIEGGGHVQVSLALGAGLGWKF